MGRGDKRTTKGKRFKGSFGKSRPQRSKKATVASELTTKTKKAKATKAEKPAVKKAPAKKAAKKKASE